MGRTGVVADVDARGAEPAGQFIEVWKPDRGGQIVFRSGAPGNGHTRGQAAGDFLESFKRPAFFPAAGKWMNHGVVATDEWTGDARDAVARAVRDGAHLLEIKVDCMRAGACLGQGWEEAERQTQRGHAITKLGALGAIPGDDRIEAAQG